METAERAPQLEGNLYIQLNHRKVTTENARPRKWSLTSQTTGGLNFEYQHKIFALY